MEQSRSVRLVWVDRLWPAIGIWREAILVCAGCGLVAALAQLTIPLRPVPITGQTLGVLLVGAWLGSRRGAAALLTYLALGAAGLPVFAGGTSGVMRLLGPTGGYLAGFVAAAFVVGWLSERGWDRQPGTALAAMLLGTLVIYLPGLLWLTTFVGWEKAVLLGLRPFVLSDALKIVLAAVLLPGSWQLTAHLR